MARITRTAALTAVVLLAGAAAGFGFETTKTLTLSAVDIERLEIDCGAGFLAVRGEAGLEAIEVRAEIAVEGVDDDEMEEYLRDHVELALRRSDGRAVLASHIRENRGVFFGWSRQARIDLTVRVPERLALEMDDSSGAMEIAGVGGDIRIDDSSGAIRVENAGGDVRIDDGSGDIVVEAVRGNLEIEDGSGGIDVLEVGGNVRIDDGSGSMEIRNVGGGVVVDDGSGPIDIADVERDVELRRTGSGGVHVSGIRGRVIR